jgi:hypothetical protein
MHKPEEPDWLELIANRVETTSGIDSDNNGESIVPEQGELSDNRTDVELCQSRMDMSE